MKGRKQSKRFIEDESERSQTVCEVYPPSGEYFLGEDQGPFCEFWEELLLRGPEKCDWKGDKKAAY